ncbi:MAG: hypothetical protein HZB56_18305 [Deltaproteobacteria bacterium]|nr:hypothetical protein [Deltaproteobacteria bacterium]
MRGAALPLLLAAASGCAGLRPPPPALQLPGETLEVSRQDLDLLAKNDEELYAVGQAARQAGDHRRAAAALGRLADRFPESRRREAALAEAGRAHLALGEWRPALQRFEALARAAAGPGADEATFEAAACHHLLGERAEAQALLAGLLARGDLAPAARVRALTERGVLELEAGALDAAGRSLEEALDLADRAQATERLGDEPPAKAHYWMGELLRARFAAAPLDLAAGEEAVAEALERKGDLLLAAQAHYLRASRRGSPAFGVAGVVRVGELYESLHAQLSGAVPPPGLSPDEAAAWREELEAQLSVLVHKAVAAYEEAIAAARARGLDPSLVEDAARALERLKALLLSRQERPGADPAR